MPSWAAHCYFVRLETDLVLPKLWIFLNSEIQRKFSQFKKTTSKQTQLPLASCALCLWGFYQSISNLKSLETHETVWACPSDSLWWIVIEFVGLEGPYESSRPIPPFNVCIPNFSIPPIPGWWFPKPHHLSSRYPACATQIWMPLGSLH